MSLWHSLVLLWGGTVFSILKTTCICKGWGFLSLPVHWQWLFLAFLVCLLDLNRNSRCWGWIMVDISGNSSPLDLLRVKQYPVPASPESLLAPLAFSSQGLPSRASPSNSSKCISERLPFFLFEAVQGSWLTGIQQFPSLPFMNVSLRNREHYKNESA